MEISTYSESVENDKMEASINDDWLSEYMAFVVDPVIFENDNLGFGIFEKVDKDLGLSRGTAWDASGWKDYCDFGFGDV